MAMLPTGYSAPSTRFSTDMTRPRYSSGTRSCALLVKLDRAPRYSRPTTYSAGTARPMLGALAYSTSATGSAHSTATSTRREPCRLTSGPSATAMVTAPRPCAVTSAEVPALPACSTLSAIGATSAMNGAASNELTAIRVTIERMPSSRDA